MGSVRDLDLAGIIGPLAPVDVVDVGANPIDGQPPYKPLLERGYMRLVGFEPQRDALERLKAAKGPDEIYLPNAVGDGQPGRFYVCQAPGMSSTLAPNTALLRHFHKFLDWSKVVEERDIETVRLDEVAEIEDLDYLKIDVQGGEMAVFKGGREKLAAAVAIQTEVSFLPLYREESMFGEVDLMLRDLGYMPHCFASVNTRAVAPLVVGGSIYKGLNQLFQADIVYIKNFDEIEALPSKKLKSLAMVLHYCYGSVDVAQFVLLVHDRQFGSEYWQRYMDLLGAGQLQAVTAGPK